MQMDAEHFYEGDQIQKIGPVTHVRIGVHPDGGVMRLRLFGTKV
jgi:allantoicase